ncbi:hypothetical protein WMY93_018912 [Mugilogobius chulae]|uniref:Uncharacterized protein n=1 Tax=Mugilogobius chulae TaxID=88201 RepID=A0AAW0NLG6_9GOBI
MLQTLSFVLFYDDRCSVFGSLETGFRHSPRHTRRSVHPRSAEEKSPLADVPESNQLSSSTQLRKRKSKKRVLPEFYQSIQVTPTRRAAHAASLPSRSSAASTHTYPLSRTHRVPAVTSGDLTSPRILNAPIKDAGFQLTVWHQSKGVARAS